MKTDPVYAPLKPFNPHSNCVGHKMSFLEDPMDTKEDRDMMLKILDGYWPEEKEKPLI